MALVWKLIPTVLLVAAIVAGAHRPSAADRGDPT